jgi:hypothetical protein
VDSSGPPRDWVCGQQAKLHYQTAREPTAAGAGGPTPARLPAVCGDEQATLGVLDPDRFARPKKAAIRRDGVGLPTAHGSAAPLGREAASGFSSSLVSLPFVVLSQIDMDLGRFRCGNFCLFRSY